MVSAVPRRVCVHRSAAIRALAVPQRPELGRTVAGAFSRLPGSPHMWARGGHVAGRDARGRESPDRSRVPAEPRNPDPRVPPWGVRELLCPCVLPYPGGCSAVFDGSLGPGDPAATAGSGSWAPSHPVPGLLRRKWSRRRSGPSASSPTAAWTWTNYWTCPSKREPGEGWPREGALRPYTECRRVVGMRGGKT